MAYFLSFSGLAILVIIFFMALQAAKAKNDELLQHSEPFRDWFESQDLSLRPHRDLIKKGLLMLVVIGWCWGVLLAALNEGAAYTLLVVLLGWAPAFALSLILTGAILALVQLLRGGLFCLRWLGRVRSSLQVAKSSKSDAT